MHRHGPGRQDRRRLRAENITHTDVFQRGKNVFCLEGIFFFFSKGLPELCA